MFFDPPLNKRTDKELFDMISNDEKWSAEAATAGYEELMARGIPEQDIIRMRDHRLDVLRRYRERVGRQHEANAKMSYNFVEMIAIIVGFPFILLSKNVMNEFARLEKYNYQTKIWQRSTLIFVSILVWVIILSRIA